MEENNNTEAKEEGVEIPPFFGIFRMSRFERIFHAFVIHTIGAAFIAFTIWKRSAYGQGSFKQILELSNWYVLPCYILSVFLLMSAFPVVGKKNVVLQHMLRCFMAIAWMVMYLQASQILFMIFYKYLPA